MQWALFLILFLISIYSDHFLFNINCTLINGFSLTYGLTSFFFNSVFPYGGKDFSTILFLLNIWLACFAYISSITLLFNFSVKQP